MNKREIYTRTVIYDDGNVAVMDATEEVIRMRRELKRPAKEVNETMSVEEVAAMFKVDKRTIQNWKSLGKLVEGKHYKRLSTRHSVYYKKPLMKLLDMG